VPDLTAKRLLLVVALAGALVGAAVASGVAEASSSATTSNSSSSGSSGSVATASVVRTNLQSTVQVGGSIGFQGSYVVAAPTGTSAQQLAQAQQQVTQAQQALTADQTQESDGAASDNEAVVAAQNAVNTAASALSADQAKQTQDCAGPGAASPACGQDSQKVDQDQSQLAQAQQQLATAKLNEARNHDQAQAKVQSDTTQLQNAEANLAALQPTAVNTGTTYTYLPKVGDIISEDQPVYTLNGQPVPLLYGSIAAYRAFYLGMPDGADVGQLTQDLLALGYGAGLTQSNRYSTATAAAVRRWQAALGLPPTGTILLGQVVFEPVPIRVTSVTPSVGQAVGGGGSGGGTVLDATSTTPVVTVALNVTQEYLVKPGDAVTVVLPDGSSTVGGHVETVGDVALCPGGNGSGSGSGSPNANNSSADQSPCASSGSGSSSTPTVTVTITVDSTPPGATLDQAPVNVNITTQRADNVLAVPVNALLALQGGGYGVDVVNGATHHLVAVTTGLYSNTMVQVSGSGITEGTLVEVPSP
jgi:hypothetical protein